MIEREEILEVLKNYDTNSLKIGCVGSHSALDIADGAKDEGFETYVWCQKGREEPYSRYFKSVYHNGKLFKGCVDHPIVVGSFKDVLNYQDMIRKNSILWVANRSFVTYCGIDEVENNFKVPYIGSRNLLRIEEREEEKNYYWLCEKANLPTPKQVSPDQIDKLTIVKLHHAKMKLERGFFTCASTKEFEEKSQSLIDQGVITKEDLEKARIEEYAIGPVFNFNFFYSPVSAEIGEEPVELLGIDWRFESSLDGFVRIPAEQQLTLPESQKYPIMTVVGHNNCTIRESLLRNVFPLAEKFVKVTQEYYPPGIIGAFTIQTVITSDMKPVIYDIATRVGGGTNVHMWFGAPYANVLWRARMSSGRRTALEVKRAVENDMLEKIVT
ncbi:MAG: formate--phosphoribosylaminoimidazolecarboxamide ligase family protein [Candidatus Odinarchaeia archaeon]